MIDLANVSKERKTLSGNRFTRKPHRQWAAKSRSRRDDLHLASLTYSQATFARFLFLSLTTPLCLAQILTLDAHRKRPPFRAKAGVEALAFFDLYSLVPSATFVTVKHNGRLYNSHYVRDARLWGICAISQSLGQVQARVEVVVCIPWSILAFPSVIPAEPLSIAYTRPQWRV